MGRSHASTVRRTKQNAATLEESLVAVGAPMAVGVQYTLPKLRRVGKEQKNALHKYIFMGGSNASIVRQTKQISATLGVSLVVLGPPWGPLWPWACNMPILDLDEVVENKKPFYIRIFPWERHMLAL